MGSYSLYISSTSSSSTDFMPGAWLGSLVEVRLISGFFCSSFFTGSLVCILDWGLLGVAIVLVAVVGAFMPEALGVGLAISFGSGLLTAVDGLLMPNPPVVDLD